MTEPDYDLLNSAQKMFGHLNQMQQAIKRVRKLYDKTCAETVNGCSSDLEIFLSDLREALDGEQ